MTEATVVFAAVVGGRFLLPLLILRYPLPAIIGCLVLDGVDQTIFQAFGHDPPGYQSYDKAMDVFYLALAYLATMRNWTSRPAFEVGRFLYFYRLVGVLAFELSGQRWMLLVFANTFEYFFIAYEVVRLRWDPARLGARFWVVVAAATWVVVKLPQEWWIHVAQLDLTDELAARAWLGPALGALVLAAVGAVVAVAGPRLGRPDWSWRVRAEVLPREVDRAHERAAWLSTHERVWSLDTVEKVVLVGLLSVIYARVLPGAQVSDTQVFVFVAVFVLINAALILAWSRAGRTVESAATAFAVRAAVNIGLVEAANLVLDRRPGDIDLGPAIFLVVLLSLLTVLHDRYRPVVAVRLGRRRRPGGAPGRAAGSAPTSAR